MATCQVRSSLGCDLQQLDMPQCCRAPALPLRQPSICHTVLIHPDKAMPAWSLADASAGPASEAVCVLYSTMCGGLQLGPIQRQAARPVWTPPDPGWQLWEACRLLVTCSIVFQINAVVSVSL